MFGLFLSGPNPRFEPLKLNNRVSGSFNRIHVVKITCIPVLGPLLHAYMYMHGFKGITFL